MPRPEFTVSMMSLYGTPTPYLLGYPVRGLADIARESGYGGIEVHPMRVGTAALQIRMALLNQYERDALTRAHQSYRSEPDLTIEDLLDGLRGVSKGQARGNQHPTFVHPNRSAALQAQLLHERTASLSQLVYLQTVVDHKLPVVLYPGREGQERPVAQLFPERLVQPTPELMKEWNVENIPDLTRKMYALGYTGWCLDLYHIRKELADGTKFGPWQETFPQLLPDTHEVHSRMGTDMLDQGVNGMSELADLLSPGPYTSEQAAMLRFIGAARYTGPITMEITTAELGAFHHLSILSPGQLIADHKQLIHSCSELLSAAPTIGV